jgi:flagellin-like protein
MKGTTPIIAVILLLLITIAAGGSTYLWLSRTQSKLFTQTTTGIEESGKDVYGKITVVSIWNQTTMLCVLVRNGSDQDITYKKADLQKMAILMDKVPCSFNNSAELNDIRQSEVVSFCIDNSTSQCRYDGTESSIMVKVEPPFGNGDDYEFTYP